MKDSSLPEGELGWARLSPVLVIHLCSTLGFSIALPFLIFLVEDLGGTSWTYGLLGATYSAAQMIGAPILGRWSDRVGRRTVLLVSQGGTAVAWILFLVATLIPRDSLGTFGGATITAPLVLIFLARLLDGLTAGNISVANAYVADITQSAKRARQIAFGRMGMAASLGFTLGPALSGLLGSWSDGYTGPILAAIAVSCSGIALCLTLLEPGSRCPEGPPAEAAVGRVIGQEHRRCDRPPSRASAELFADPVARLFLATTFLIFLAFNIYYAAFPVHATRAIGWSTVEMGLFYSLMSGAMFAVQGPLLQYASSRFGSKALFGGGVVGLMAAFTIFPVATTVMAFAGGAFFALGNGISWATFQARTAGVAPEHEQGALQGALSSAGSLASILGLSIGGWIYPSAGGTLFLGSAALFAVVLLLTPRLFPASD